MDLDALGTDAVDPILGPNGELPNSGDPEFLRRSGFPDISDDGTRVVFESQAQNLDPSIPAVTCTITADTQCYAQPGEGFFDQVFVADITDPAAPAVSLVTRIGAAGAVTSADGSSNLPVISGDGSSVAYMTDAADIPDVPSGTTQVYLSPVPNTDPGTYARISEGTTVTAAVCDPLQSFLCNRVPSIDRLGRNVAWSSNGDPLDVAATDPTPSIPLFSGFLQQNVYVRDPDRRSMSVSVPNIDFGLVPVGSTASVTVTVTNDGLTPFVIAEMFAGQPSTILPGPGNGCTIGGTIAPNGGTCTVIVTATPLTTDFFEGSYGLNEDPNSFQYAFVSGNTQGAGTDLPLRDPAEPRRLRSTNIGTTSRRAPYGHRTSPTSPSRSRASASAAPTPATTPCRTTPAPAPRSSPGRRAP